ncbi:MAG: ABC transporter permease [Caulobacteraceae bacterium]
MTNVIAERAPLAGPESLAAPPAGRRDEFWRGLWVVAYRELLRLAHDKARLASSLAQPLLFFVMFGAGFKRAIGGMAPGVDFIQFLFPGIIAQTVFMTSIFSGLSVVWDREFGFLRELLVAPISRFGIVAGKVVGGAILAVAQAAVVLCLGPFLKVHLTLEIILTVIPLLVLFSFALSSLGILMASRISSQQGFQMMMQLFIMPMIFLSGAFFPLNNVPPWLSVVSRLNPLTYGVDAIRHAFLDPVAKAGAHPLPFNVVWFGHAMTLWEDAAVIGVIGAGLLAAAIQAFSSQE